MENVKTEPQSPGYSDSGPCALCSVDMAKVSAHLEHLLSTHFDIVSAAIHGMESAGINNVSLKPELSEGSEPVISTHQQFSLRDEPPVSLISQNSSDIHTDQLNHTGNKQVIVIQPQLNMDCEKTQTSTKAVKTNLQYDAIQSSEPAVSQAETFRIDKLPRKIVSPYRTDSSTTPGLCSRQNTIIHPGAIHMPKKKGCVSKITMNPCRAKLATSTRGKPIWGTKLRLAQLDLLKSSNKSPKPSDTSAKKDISEIRDLQKLSLEKVSATQEYNSNKHDSGELPQKTGNLCSSEAQTKKCPVTQQEQLYKGGFQTEYVDVIPASGKALISYMSQAVPSAGFDLTLGFEDLLGESQLFIKRINSGLFSQKMQSLDGFNQSIATYQQTIRSIQTRIRCMVTAKYQLADHFMLYLDQHQEAQLGSSLLEFYVPVMLHPVDDTIRNPTTICQAVSAIFLQPSAFTSNNLHRFSNLLKALLIHCLITNRDVLMAMVDRDHNKKYAGNVFSRLLIMDPNLLEPHEVNILFVALSIVLQRDMYIYEISTIVQVPQPYKANDIHDSETTLGVCKQMIYTAPKALRLQNYEANCPCCLLHKQSNDEYFGLVRKTDEPARLIFPWYTKPFIF